MGTANTLDVAADHPAYAGHFPGTPVLPGVVLLDAVLRQVAGCTARPAAQWQIAAAKFHSPTVPGESLRLEHEMLADGSLRFSVHTVESLRHGRIVATGVLRLQVPTS